MATIRDPAIRLKQETYEALEAEADRRHLAPDELADQLVSEQLRLADGKSMDEWLAQMDELSSHMPKVDAVQLVRDGREELERRALRWQSS